jgi:hypothetical protein
MPPVGIAHPLWGAQTHTRAEGVEIRRRSVFAVTMVSVYSNGEIGYVPMKRDDKKGGYGLWRSPLASGSDELLIEAVGDLLEAATGA